MLVRKFVCPLVAVGLLVANLLTPSCDAVAADEDLAKQVRDAERILIGVPEKDVDAPGGEQFLVEIQEVLRGTGKRGTLARIANAGTREKYPRFKAGKAYVFLLAKNAADKGWVNLSPAEIGINDESVQIVTNGNAPHEVSRKVFDRLVRRIEDTGPARQNLAGNWVLTISQQGADMAVWLVGIKQNDKGAYDARLLETAKAWGGATTLKEFAVTDKEARLVLFSNGANLDFMGTLQDGTVRGTIDISGQVVVPAWLAPTQAANLAKNGEPVPTLGQAEFMKAIGPNPAVGPLQAFVRNFDDSPLALDAYGQLLGAAKADQLDEAAVSKLAEEFLQAAKKWGPRIELRANIDIGLVLSSQNEFPDLALAYLNNAEKLLTEATPERWRKLLFIEKGKRLLAMGQDAEGLALLRKMREQYPLSAELTFLLAQSAEKAKQNDEALGLYAQVAAVPQLEQILQQTLAQTGRELPPDDVPSRAVARLWKAQHGGDMQGLPQFLDKVYDDSIHSIAGEKQPARGPDGGTRVVLCELFTGAMCPPCVGADVATTALEAAYDRSQVIVLRYHQHVPGPDPLANEQSQERFEEYSGQGTPLLVVNGREFEGAGGFIENAPDIYQRLRQVVAPFLGEKINLKVELSAKAAGGKIQVSARAAGLKKFPEDVKLHLALAEDKIRYSARNGIRFHEMVVRAMPGGVEGIDPDNGQLSWSGEIDLAQLKAELGKYLAKKEGDFAMQFDDKPLELGELHLVGFLQNEDTSEVLQAAAVPVAGVAAASSSARSGQQTVPAAKAPAPGRK